MAKKRDEYPANKSIGARLDCLIQSHSTMRSLVRSIKDVVLPGLTGELKDVVARQIDDALLRAQIASEAISGMEDDDG